MNNKNFTVEDGVLLKYHGKERSVSVPEGITEIGRGAFRACLFLEKVTLPSTLERIGDYAFDSCARLAKITLPRSVREIGVSAFGFCISLSEFETEDNSCLMTVGDEAFLECEGLRRVTLPESVTKVGKSAFSGSAGELLTLNSAKISFSAYAAREGSFIYAPWLIPSAFHEKYIGGVICGYFAALACGTPVSDKTKNRYNGYFERNRGRVMVTLARMVSSRRLLAFAVEYLLVAGIPGSDDCDRLLDLLGDDAETATRVISYKRSHYGDDTQGLGLLL